MTEEVGYRKWTDSGEGLEVEGLPIEIFFRKSVKKGQKEVDGRR